MQFQAVDIYPSDPRGLTKVLYIDTQLCLFSSSGASVNSFLSRVLPPFLSLLFATSLLYFRPLSCTQSFVGRKITVSRKDHSTRKQGSDIDYLTENTVYVKIVEL
ncbi:hypothetical protein AcW2_006879 [Taiwanofungus camphoratus]|nr:hypothetical protein AcW2_006879 [Antrodia cinnamomea]